MLVSGERLLSVVLVGSFDPVPAAVSVSPEAPGVLQSTLVIGPTAKNDHHSSSATHMAHCSRVVDTDLGRVAWRLEFQPGERSLVHVQAPDVADRLSSSVSTENQQIWLVEHDGVAVPSARGLTNHRHDHPLSHGFSVSQVKEVQVVRGETASSGCTAVDDHLETVHSATTVSGSRRRSNTSTV